jgi:hypothetical protein
MSCFTFDFDLEDDLDESFDAITPQEPAAAPSIDKTVVSESAPEGVISAEEVPLSTLVRDTDIFLTTNLIWVWQRSFPHSPKHSHIHL